MSRTIQRKRNWVALFSAMLGAAMFSISGGPAAQGVQGHVAFANGKPATQVFVQARSLERPAPAIPDIGIFTDGSGNYSWPLPPGRFELTFIHQGRKLATRNVTVERSGIARLDVRLSAGE
jgi:hypothetical protein